MTQQSLWRLRSNPVGYLDIAFTLICEIAILFGVTAKDGIKFVMGTYTLDITSLFPNPELVVQVASWLCLISATLLSCFQFLAAVQLLAATKPGLDPQTALKLANYWFKVTVIHVFLVVIPIFLLGSLNALWVIAVVRFSFVGVVSRFMFELREILKVEQA